MTRKNISINSLITSSIFPTLMINLKPISFNELFKSIKYSRTNSHCIEECQQVSRDLVKQLRLVLHLLVLAFHYRIFLSLF